MVAIYTAQKDMDLVKKTITTLSAVGKYTGDVTVIFSKDIKKPAPHEKYFADKKIQVVRAGDLLPTVDQPQPRCKSTTERDHEQRWSQYERLAIFNHTFWQQWCVAYCEILLEVHLRTRDHFAKP